MEPFLTSRHRPTVNHAQWKKEFSVRRTALYLGQDSRLRVPIGGSMIDEFFNSASPDLVPPRRHELLRKFLDQTGARSFPEALNTTPADTRVLAMIDDRCDPCLQFTDNPDGTSFLPMRQWESEEYMRRPPEGIHNQIYGADAGTLYDCLNKNRKGVAERRILYLVDLTPLMGLALISGVTYMQLPQIRSFLSRHVAFDTHMGISQIRGFTLEFHLPHYVLRPSQTKFQDRRGLRKHRFFRPPRSDDSDCIYEAQLSLVVSGVDDYFWTACFCEDSYFRGKNPIPDYLEDKVDGPSFGLRMSKYPIWDPRYYFLSILSIRMSQVAMEWTVIVGTLEGHLDKHGEIDEDSIDHFLEDEPSLLKTKEYTWILCTLRRLRNSLARLIATWAAFDMNNSVYFNLDTDGALYDKFRECFQQIRQSTAELATQQMVLEQRIEMLEKMSGVLVNASSLSESITATRQGDNIRLLTYITIVYLPVTLVTGAFSMNQVSSDIPWWKYWVALFCLTGCTIAVALGLQLLIPRLRVTGVRLKNEYHMYTKKKISRPPQEK
ncbi:hypothetical protein BDV30DRAFT_235745 [Aspergillus minisclerotigenes]|uniref:Cora-like Mg2+ transporter protein-domain-containing protein n=1 Tax=Aspergillus minisclerotigenes TaxID=656917 RepID=A0A5N6JDC3_9EURO|nr:hypothetical protein BDV30DRAFT_235745 [Aspergillus minisclerotigenes]